MAEDAVRRAGSVPTLGGFAGRHPDHAPSPRRETAMVPSERPAQDEVVVRSDVASALQLLRERVLARTRLSLAIGDVSIPVFAEVRENESVQDFLSRLLSEQNQLAAHAMAPSRADLTAAFEEGAAETLELLAAISRDGSGAVGLVLAEFHRRLAGLASEPRA